MPPSPRHPPSPLSARPPIYSQAQQQRQALTDALNSPVLAPERDSISYSNIGLGLLSYSSAEEEVEKPYSRQGRESRVESLENRKQIISQAGELGTMSPTPPTPIHLKGRERQRPITIIDFPDPQLHPSQSPWALPPPSSPISPMLASPHPSSSFISSSDNASIRGLDILSEKKALFRSDDDAVAEAIPRIGGTRRQRHPGAVSVAGADFWKRFSTVVRLDEASKRGPKDQGWLDRHKAKNRRLAILVAVLSVLIVGIILFCAIFFTLQAKANAPKNQGNLPTFGTAVSHSASRTAASAVARVTAAAP